MQALRRMAEGVLVAVARADPFRRAWLVGDAELVERANEAVVVRARAAHPGVQAAARPKPEVEHGWGFHDQFAVTVALRSRTVTHECVVVPVRVRDRQQHAVRRVAERVEEAEGVVAVVRDDGGLSSALRQIDKDVAKLGVGEIVPARPERDREPVRQRRR